jgi:hypothetical protein
VATRLTKGLTKKAAATMTPGERATLVDLLHRLWLPNIESKKRARAQYGATLGGEIAYKVPKKITGKQFCILPGIYCDVVQWGTGPTLPSVVMCDLDLMDKGVRKLIKTLEEVE